MHEACRRAVWACRRPHRLCVRFVHVGSREAAPVLVSWRRPLGTNGPQPVVQRRVLVADASWGRCVCDEQMFALLTAVFQKVYHRALALFLPRVLMHGAQSDVRVSDSVRSSTARHPSPSHRAARRRRPASSTKWSISLHRSDAKQTLALTAHARGRVLAVLRSSMFWKEKGKTTVALDSAT